MRCHRPRLRPCLHQTMLYLDAIERRASCMQDHEPVRCHEHYVNETCRQMLHGLLGPGCFNFYLHAFPRAHPRWDPPPLAAQVWQRRGVPSTLLRSWLRYLLQRSASPGKSALQPSCEEGCTRELFHAQMKRAGAEVLVQTGVGLKQKQAEMVRQAQVALLQRDVPHKP